MEAIGMSRASWYRHGKPTEKPERTPVAAAARAAGCLGDIEFLPVSAVGLVTCEALDQGRLSYG